MAFYETVLIARHEITQGEVEKYIEEFSNILKERKGKIVKKEYWGLLQLAYEIKKCRKGHYVLLCIDAPFDAMKEMHRIMKLNENIIRHITFNVEEFDSEPSAIMVKSIQKQKAENAENAVNNYNKQES